MEIDHSFYLSLALKEAWKYQFLTYPNPAVGVLVLDKYGKIISIEAHQEAGKEHAELNAIWAAFEKLIGFKSKTFLTPKEKHTFLLKNHNYLFKNFTIYVTLEPCMREGKTPACSILLERLGFSKVVIGALDPNENMKGGAFYLKEKGIEVVTGVLEKECKELIEPFYKWQKEESFVFFKYAQTLNGVVSGGVISSLKSREFVHKIRKKIDLLVIGGNTVREDRPTLDTRLSGGGENPDVLIYSKRGDFDRSIPLFSIKGREVFIENSLDRIKDYKFVMIEGGEGMLEASKEVIDWILVFEAPFMKRADNIKSDLKLKRLNLSSFYDDNIIWFKKIKDSLKII